MSIFELVHTPNASITSKLGTLNYEGRLTPQYTDTKICNYVTESVVSNVFSGGKKTYVISLQVLLPW